MLRISLTTGVLVLVGLTSSFEYGGYPGCFNPYVPPGIVPSPPLGPTFGPVPPPIGITAPTGFGVGPPPVPFTPSPFGCGSTPYGYGYGYPYGYPGYANCGSCGNGVLCGGCGACGTCGGGCNCGFPNGNCGGSCPFNNCGCGNCGPNSFGSCSACNSCPIPNTYIPGYFLEDPTSSQKYLVPPVLIAGAGCCNSFCGSAGTCNSIADGVQTAGSCGTTTVSGTGASTGTNDITSTVEGTETGDSTSTTGGTGSEDIMSTAGSADVISSALEGVTTNVVDTSVTGENNQILSLDPVLRLDTIRDGLVDATLLDGDVLRAGVNPNFGSLDFGNIFGTATDPLDFNLQDILGVTDLTGLDMKTLADAIDSKLADITNDAGTE